MSNDATTRPLGDTGLALADSSVIINFKLYLITGDGPITKQHCQSHESIVCRYVNKSPIQTIFDTQCTKKFRI